VSRIVIAGGGTGGHIYPGLAVAKALVDLGHQVEWVGAVGGLEEKIVPREGLPLHLIKIGKLHHTVGLWTRLKTVLGFPFAFAQAMVLVLKLKPAAVLGVGGFASGPFLFVASLMGKRTVIWEPNAKAGLTNRLLAKLADECLLVFEEAAKDLPGRNVHRVGLPVRSSILPGERAPLKGRSFRILVFGGSQGARAINKAVTAWVASDQWSGDIELVHQTGRYDFEETKKVYADLLAQGRKINVTCLEYIHDMDARYTWADLIICRAGASTAAELAASGKATIFVPLPSAADDHQLKNAKVFEAAGAAMIIEQKNLTVESLSRAVRAFQDDPVLVERLELAVRKFASPKAAEIIAGHVLGGGA
jgi:UDP-N-acetylglucosamine--N-acetylmuramyl-(pentapeptide) pyrophosphoryl-undecaprenol N-acetylglucosamine transferase